MVTGRRAFQGANRISTLSAILEKEPQSAGELAPDLPVELEKIITRCLRKDRERRAQHIGDIKLALEEVKELADGYAFRLAGDSVSVAELGEWAAAERKCCPFFDFEIEAERDNGALWLKLRGREGVKAFIQTEFRLAR